MFRPDKFYRTRNMRNCIGDFRAAAIDRAARGFFWRPARRLITRHRCCHRARNRLLIAQTQPRGLAAICASSTEGARGYGSASAPRRVVVVIGAGFIGLEFAATGGARGGSRFDCDRNSKLRVIGARCDGRNLGIFPGAAQTAAEYQLSHPE